jgi:hypothetical protein
MFFKAPANYCLLHGVPVGKELLFMRLPFASFLCPLRGRAGWDQRTSALSAIAPVDKQLVKIPDLRSAIPCGNFRQATESEDRTFRISGRVPSQAGLGKKQALLLKNRNTGGSKGWAAAV